jgi:hypothetical protein
MLSIKKMTCALCRKKNFEFTKKEVSIQKYKKKKKKKIHFERKVVF